MDLLLQAPNIDSELSSYYKRAFKNAVELFVVTAYLTEWDASLELNPECRSFRVIIGRDFGITRKAVCETVMRWLPPKRKAQFMVADRIGGFHPKAVFWKEEEGKCFAIVGSSNLTQAAFGTNYEANVFFTLSGADYAKGKEWVKHIEKQSVVVSEDWLKKYKEALPAQQHRTKGSNKVAQDAAPVVELATRLVSTVPGSQGLYAPSWSSDGRYIVANCCDPMSASAEKLVLYDGSTQKWVALVDFPDRNSGLGWHAWSRNGKFVYFTSQGTDGGVFRIGISDRRPQKVTTLKDLDPTGFALSPDDEPLISRQTSSSEIYALEWEAP